MSIGCASKKLFDASEFFEDGKNGGTNLGVFDGEGRAFEEHIFVGVRIARAIGGADIVYSAGIVFA